MTTKRIINVLAVLVIATLLFMNYNGYTNSNVLISNDTVTLVRRDTLRDTIRVENTHWKTKEITKERRVVDTIKVEKDTVLTRESKHYQDTLVFGQNKAILDVFLSGVDPTLDSTKIEAHTANYETIVETTITNTIERKKRFKDRLFVAPSVGVGYGLINNKADVYVGISAGIKIW